jgi:hypothetical protein
MHTWPDPLSLPEADRIQQTLADFWAGLASLADLLARGELVLAEGAITRQREVIVEMMLAANGIAYPRGTRHLNGYLGESQRIALERTLVAAGASREAIMARMVALTTIYRWYAPQLVARYGVVHPDDAESQTWRVLLETLPEWPVRIETE